NNALFVVNNLSQQFTEALKSRIRSQTALSIVRTGEADATFSGAITNYSITPVSVQATNNSNTPPIANASRLSITVKVKYNNQAVAAAYFDGRALYKLLNHYDNLLVVDKTQLIVQDESQPLNGQSAIDVVDTPTPEEKDSSIFTDQPTAFPDVQWPGEQGKEE